jgi:membrane-bound serine protease (ClpP class)
VRKWVYFCLLVIGVLAVLPWNNVSAASPGEIYVLHVEGAIVPVVADYINRGLNYAEEHNAACVVIELDTPGGLLSSTQEIVERLLNADVPVVVYVTPSGAWAASAGAFITVAAEVAAMAPGTSIGAAHPVGGGGDEVMDEKVTEATAAMIRSIAEKRGRDAEVLESMVWESKAFSAEEALALGVVDINADNFDSLISQLIERETLEDRDYTRNEIGMNAVEKFLHAISEPNIAYLLLTLGTLGLIFELANPGTILPGVVGAICLILGFYSLYILEAYWAGIILVVLGFAMFIAELFITSYGLLSLGGIASLVMGSLILFSGTSPIYGEIGVSPWLIGVIVAVVVAFFLFVLRAVIRTQRRKQPTGREGLVGKMAEVKTPLEPEGMIMVHGELWQAIIEEGRAELGEEVIITKVEGLKLRVNKKGRK